MPQKPQMLRTPHQPVELSAIHVRWSPQQDAYLAWSDAHPGHTATDTGRGPEANRVIPYPATEHRPRRAQPTWRRARCQARAA
ncbi:hypothetical protein AB0I30_35620 [Nocardia tengchongensis]|uniref:hypothetical protein n=1 Tax=Nocardia tengchongensis TaxID=2055889 RepID=UPI00340C2BEB